MLWNHLRQKRFWCSVLKTEIISPAKLAETIRYEQVERKITKIKIENATDQGIGIRASDGEYTNPGVPPKVLNIQHIVMFNDTISILNWADGNKVG